MNIYTPDRWVLVELTHKGEKIRKVFSGNYGGYLSGDTWKISSETIKTLDKGDYFEFHQHSGSIYHCYKSNYGLSMYMQTVLNRYISQNTLETYITLLEKKL